MQNTRQKICLAIGDTKAEAWVKQKLGDEYDFTKDCNHKGMIMRVLQNENPDIILLKESLTSNMGDNGKRLSTDYIISQIQIRFKCRIVLIAGNHTPGDDFLNRAVSRGVYDILYGQEINFFEVLDMIRNPRDYSFACKLQGIEPIAYEDEDEAAEPDLVETVNVERKKQVIPAVPSKTEEEPQKTEENPVNINNYNRVEDEPQQIEEPEEKTDIQGYIGEPDYGEFDENSETNVIYGNNDKNSEELPYSDGTTVLTADMMDDYDVEYGVYGGSYDDTSVLSVVRPKGIIFRPAVSDDFAVFEKQEQVIKKAKSHVYETAKETKESVNDNPLLQNKILYSNNTNNQIVPWNGGSVRRCRVTVVGAARQGVGCTTTAINTAIALSLKKKRVLLIDGVMGSSCIFEKLSLPDAGKTFDELQENMKYGRRPSPNDYVSKLHMNKAAVNKKLKERYDNLPNSLSFLRLSERVNYSTANSDMVSELIDALSHDFDQIIIDVSLSLADNLTKAFINCSDDVLIVTLQDVYELNSTKKCVDFYNTTAPIRGKMTCILNRYKRAMPDAANVCNFFSIANTIVIPEDTERIVKASSNGLPYYNVARRRNRTVFDGIAEQIR